MPNPGRLARGLPKLMLLIREENKAVSAFYAGLGYGQEPRLVMSKTFGAEDRPGPDAMIDVVVTYLEMTEAPTRRDGAAAGRRPACRHARRGAEHGILPLPL